MDKLTKKETAKQISSLIMRKKNIENGLPPTHNDHEIYQEYKSVLSTYKSFLKLPKHEQERITKEWDDYFEAVTKTKAYLRYGKQSEAMKKGKLSLVKEFAEKAREQKELELKEPPGYDPKWMVNSFPVIEYYRCQRLIDKLTGKDDAEAIEAFI